MWGGGGEGCGEVSDVGRGRGGMWVTGGGVIYVLAWNEEKASMV